MHDDVDGNGMASREDMGSAPRRSDGGNIAAQGSLRRYHDNDAALNAPRRNGRCSRSHAK